MNNGFPRAERLYQYACSARQRVARMTGSDGLAVSSVDLLVGICGGLNAGGSSSGSNRDYVLLSKGHAVHALAATLVEFGYASEVPSQQHERFTSDLCWYPGLQLPGVSLKSRSLCELLAVGIELAGDTRRRGSNAKVFVLVSGAHISPAALWDSVRFMAAQAPQRLVLIIEDHSAALAFGNPFTRRFDAFGWDVLCVDGHSLSELHRGLHGSDSNRPRLVIADTADQSASQTLPLESRGWMGY